MTDDEAGLISEIKDGKTIRIFKKGRFLGKGGFARVYEGEDFENGEIYALKLVDKEIFGKHPDVRSKLTSEIAIHKELDHPNVVKF